MYRLNTADENPQTFNGRGGRFPLGTSSATWTDGFMFGADIHFLEQPQVLL